MGQSYIDSKKAFWIFTALGVLTAAAIAFGLHQSMNWCLTNLSGNVDGEMILKKVAFLIERVSKLSPNFYSAVVPIIVGLTLLTGWLLWGVLKIFAGSKRREPAGEGIQQVKDNQKKDFIDRKLEQERKIRLFLHPLTALQREGRLLDFFEEDLTLYDDEQIGAAVRSIHEDCKKTIKKYINLKAVIAEEEGDEILIEKGFDIDSIALTGNVSGDPPFKGVVRHRGWKAGKKELPKLSDIQDATIIAPAEVEVQ